LVFVGAASCCDGVPVVAGCRSYGKTEVTRSKHILTLNVYELTHMGLCSNDEVPRETRCRTASLGHDEVGATGMDGSLAFRGQPLEAKHQFDFSHRFLKALGNGSGVQAEAGETDDLILA
jgi:hypothetical protein